MSFTITPDISRMIVAGQKEIFTRNFEAFPLEYPDITSAKTATKETETYDSMGNLKAASLKPEGDAIQFGKIEQAYQTVVKNKTWANGIDFSFETIHYDLYGVINSARAMELARTVRELEEERSIQRFDEAFTVNLADGAPLCSNSKPLKNTPGVFNDTLATGALTPDNVKAALTQFGDFKNHQGGPMRSIPTDGMTHFHNMFTVEEIFRSANQAHEFSNTRNVLPPITWHYSHYLASQDAWFIWDRSFDHVIFQRFMGVEIDSETDFDTKNLKISAIEIFETAALPNIGIVGSSG